MPRRQHQSLCLKSPVEIPGMNSDSTRTLCTCEHGVHKSNGQLALCNNPGLLRQMSSSTIDQVCCTNPNERDDFFIFCDTLERDSENAGAA